MISIRGALGMATAAAVCLVAYALLVVLPYHVNDLDRFPLADVAIGYHDPKDLWPTTIPYVGGWLHLGGVLSMVAAPMTLLVVALVCGFTSVQAIGQRVWNVATVHTVVAVVCAVAGAWFFSPFARALATWQLD